MDKFRVEGVMKKRRIFVLPALLLSAAAVVNVSCEKLPDGPSDNRYEDIQYSAEVERLERIAAFLSDAVSDPAVLNEVHSAVGESYDDGYDEEYLFTNVVANPGKGTGSRVVKSSEYGQGALFRQMMATVSGDTGFPGISVKSDGYASAFMDSLAASDIQIYWPYYDRWDGESEPVVTFDHGRDDEWNYGFILRKDASGKKVVSRVLVDEAYAKEHPVWVVNLNRDRNYVPLKAAEGPSDWENGIQGIPTKTGETIYSLMLRSFTALKNYDCWLAGASEYFIKAGAIESFTAATEAEMELFSPTITDFYLVVRRSEVGVPKEVNTIMVSDWTLQMSSIALMIVEDDGGKKTSWDTELMVKINSKSYGITVSIPLNSRDDIVWRGSLSSRYLFATDASHTKFNDVLLDIEIVETYNNSDW